MTPSPQPIADAQTTTVATHQPPPRTPFGPPLAEAKTFYGHPVVVTYVDIPFGQMVWLWVKLAAAAIPAAILIGLVGTVGVMLCALLIDVIKAKTGG